jgi:hypothetical protein
MRTVTPPTEPPVPSETEVLFPEAKRRERRRRLGVVSALLLVAALGTGLGLGFSGSSGGGHGRVIKADSNSAMPVVLPQAEVTILNLTNSDKYGDIALVGGRMLLYGPADQESNPSATATCNSAVVNPSTLKLSDLRSSSCANPTLESQRVLPITTVERNVPFNGGGVATVSVAISRVSSRSPGYRLGPVVMTFPQASTGWPTWVYGAGDLWLYDANNPGGYDLLRISESTGTVVQRLKVPAISRPILAFDADGLWLAPAVNSTGPAETALYHVSIGASSATVALKLGSEYVAWMTASGHSVWLDASSGTNMRTFLHLKGNAAEVNLRLAITSFGNEVETQGGGSTIVGSEANGLWTVLVNPAGTKQEVIRIDPGSGQYGSVASLEPGYESRDILLDADFWQAVTLDGSLYLLNPPTNAATYPYQPEGFSALYRITPPAR